MQAKCFLIICGIIALIAIYFPARHARHYDYIPLENVHNELIFIDNSNNKPNLNNCNYESKIINNRDIDIEDVYKIQSFQPPLLGGEYSPKHCNALIKVAIIIPYRNRTQQLAIFLNFMHNFLQHQELNYRLFIVYQNDTLPFNRAKMLNYGAKIAINFNYPCLILHDIDLIPISTGNLYGCVRKPRHMSSSLDTFRFNLPYLTIVGGAVAIQTEHYKAVNGMSNEFYGWGGEDDDFYKRLELHNLLPYRFTPELSKYIMLVHKKEKASQDRFERLKYSLERHRVDGINSLPDSISVKLLDLYTMVIAS